MTIADTTPGHRAEGWVNEAENRSGIWGRAACLATVDQDCRPSNRAVLVLELPTSDPDTASFATGESTRKGRDLGARPSCALTFLWPDLHRQLRLEGTARRAGDHESDAAFAGQPIEAKLLAWASAEGQPQTTSELCEALDATKRRFGSRVPRPLDWRLFIVDILRYEFWEESSEWAHKCVVYERLESGDWTYKEVGP